MVGVAGTARQQRQHAKKAAFLAHYALSGNVSAAAQAAGIDRVTHYKWLESDETYREAFAQAEQQAADALEAEARRRAVEGVDEPVFYKGDVVGAVRKYSDTLLIFLLNGARPEKYRQRHEHTGAGGAPLRIVIDRGDGA